MKIEINKITPVEYGERCYVHARGVVLENGFGIMTTQKLELSGIDVFYGIEMLKTSDYGKTFSEPRACKNLDRRYFEDGTSYAMCDATPYYHKKTGKIILTGHMAWYGNDNSILRGLRARAPLYAVYNEETGDFGPASAITLPKTPDERYYSSGTGCSQILELPTGELLIPIYFSPKSHAQNPRACSIVTVLRCSFDGEKMELIEIGNELTVDVPRGLGEPSVARLGDTFVLALRNDVTGYVSKSSDGLHYDTPRELCFDNGENLGNYNTQQHWLMGGGKLFMVYTRRAGNNDHVFRHRAPLFMAEFDTEKMCVIRSTERIVVPERGARLGNFGCHSYSDKVGYVYAAEWMQNESYGWDKCAEYGSDNSVFITRIEY